MKPRLLAAVTAALLTITMAGCSASPSTPATPGLTKLTIGLTYQPDIQFAPIYVAAKEGFFAQAGLDVIIRHHGASESLFGALQAGQEDVVFAGGDEMMQARSQGVDVVNIATIYQQYPLAILTPVNTPFHDVVSLKGRSIGLPGEYGENWFALLLLLQQNNMTVDDVNVVSIGYTQQAALMGGKVDAVVGFVNNDAVRLAAADFPVQMMPLTGLIGSGLGVSSKTLKNQTPALTAMWGAIAKAMAICVDAPQQAINDSMSFVPGLDQADNQKMAMATLTATTKLYGTRADFGQQDSATWASMADFMSSAGLLDKPVVATDAYTTQIVPPIVS